MQDDTVLCQSPKTQHPRLNREQLIVLTLVSAQSCQELLSLLLKTAVPTIHPCPQLFMDPALLNSLVSSVSSPVNLPPPAHKAA